MTTPTGSAASRLCAEPIAALDGALLLPTALPEPWNRGEPIREHFRRVVPVVLQLCPGPVVGICSTAPGEGTSWVAAGLATALAEARHEVILVDAHRTRPSHVRAFQAAVAPTRRAGTDPDEDRLLERLTIVDAAVAAGDDSAAKLMRRLGDLRLRRGVVVVDLEPLRESSQVQALAGALDGVLLVVQAERERREVISRSVESLTRAGHRVAGAVLNQRVQRIPNFLYRWL